MRAPPPPSAPGTDKEPPMRANPALND